MAVLRHNSGKIYTSIPNINRLIAPNKIGKFTISAKLEKQLLKPVAKQNKLDKFIPKELKNYCHRKGALVSTGGITIWKGSDATIKQLLERSRRFHINHGPEVKFLFAGSIIYFLRDFSLLLQAGDWIYMDGKTDHSTIATDDYFFTFVNYLSLPFPEFILHQEFTQTKERLLY